MDEVQEQLQGKNNSPHAGHRERMRTQLAERGADGMSSADILEMILFQCIPRWDTRKLSEALLRRFGG
ncbi:MAG: DNA repair protein RadC, partial [Oscillospiraceae bacterium]